MPRSLLPWKFPFVSSFAEGLQGNELLCICVENSFLEPPILLSHVNVKAGTGKAGVGVGV